MHVPALGVGPRTAGRHDRGGPRSEHQLGAIAHALEDLQLRARDEGHRVQQIIRRQEQDLPVRHRHDASEDHVLGEASGSAPGHVARLDGTIIGPEQGQGDRNDVIAEIDRIQPRIRGADRIHGDAPRFPDHLTGPQLDGDVRRSDGEVEALEAAAPLHRDGLLHRELPLRRARPHLQKEAPGRTSNLSVPRVPAARRRGRLGGRGDGGRPAVADRAIGGLSSTTPTQRRAAWRRPGRCAWGAPWAKVSPDRRDSRVRRRSELGAGAVLAEIAAGAQEARRGGADRLQERLRASPKERPDRRGSRGTTRSRSPPRGSPRRSALPRGSPRGSGPTSGAPGS